MTESARLARAVERARQDADAPTSAPPDGRARSFLAVGDPQASLARFLGVLDAHGVLGEDGRLRADVGLISIGDHFDWGPVAARAQSGRDSLALLAWLAAHPADQVVLIAGNHDLARVCELRGADDASFTRALALADAAYFGNDEAARATFHAEHPGFTTVEVVARDFSGFRASQRALVSLLLDAERFQLAHAHGDVLFVHAGVTLDELAVLGLEGTTDAQRIAAALNGALRDAWRTQRGADAPFVIPGLHRPGGARDEGEGMLFHRASMLDDERALWGKPAPRRRFGPDRLPPGLVQVIGHIQDKKTRTLLGLEGAHVHGRLRTLDVEPTPARATLHYTLGVPAPRAGCARVIYIDGGMQHVAAPRAYALYDVASGAERVVA